MSVERLELRQLLAADFCVPLTRMDLLDATQFPAEFSEPRFFSYPTLDQLRATQLISAQVLETPQVPATTARLQAGVLTITGSALADNISVTKLGTNLKVSGVTTSFAASSVSSITVYAGGGNDTVNLTAVSLPTKVYGGAGDDSLTGGSGNDILMGGSGNDILLGGSAADKVFGELGDDVIDGGMGIDTVDGIGNDTVTTSERLQGQYIEDDVADGADDFAAIRKWGNPTLGTPATVTYSFMQSGVRDLYNVDGGWTNTAISSFMPAGAIAEIKRAFDAWSQVSNIRFVEVTDAGETFNAAPGSDIRLGGHSFDGVSSVLAHGYFPPPNGDGAAGDIHFDIAENWRVNSLNGDPNTIDIFTVAAHEIGHAIGLGHEPAILALMNPFYNEAINGLQADDVQGVQTLYGQPITVPEADVFNGTTAVADNTGIVNLGTAVQGATLTKTLTVKNSGSAPLTLKPATLAGTGFTIVTNLPASLAAGAIASLVVKLDTALAGAKSATLSFANNDATENPYNFVLQGTVAVFTAPEVDVFNGTTAVADNTGIVNLGTAVQGAVLTKTLTVKNSGNAPLTLKPATLVGTGFSIVTNLPANLAAGASASLVVKLDTALAGAKSATLTFANNDATENPYNFVLQGTVTRLESQVSISDAQVTEGQQGFVNATFTITLSSAATVPVQVNYATANGTATSGSDYTATQGSVIFQPGQLTKTVVVPVSGDVEVEKDETFVLRLTTSQATLSDSEGKAVIVNDDSQPKDSRVGVFRNGAWYLDIDGVEEEQRIDFGWPDDQPVVGDWDGDGIDNVGIFRHGLFILDIGDPGYQVTDTQISFGFADDMPVVGDWDGDGKDNVGVFRHGLFILDVGLPGYQVTDTQVSFGWADDKPVAGDWDGDGKDNIGIFRHGLFILDVGAPGYQGTDWQVSFGWADDKPVTGDWDGDGKDNIGIFRHGLFILDVGAPGYQETDWQFSFGDPTDTPVAGNWNRTRTPYKPSSGVSLFSEVAH